MEQNQLIDAAIAVREFAFAPFSLFKVGSALELEDGEVIDGCNIESATYGLTVCAERVAIWKAISKGKRNFKQIVVVADTDVLTPPCGSCRQVIWEFAGDIPVTMANLHGKVETVQMRDLFPRAFDSTFLK
ncbi:MAG: cytidine deaminase [Acidobacteriota bacterium]